MKNSPLKGDNEYGRPNQHFLKLSKYIKLDNFYCPWSLSKCGPPYTTLASYKLGQTVQTVLSRARFTAAMWTWRPQHMAGKQPENNLMAVCSHAGTNTSAVVAMQYCGQARLALRAADPRSQCQPLVFLSCGVLPCHGKLHEPLERRLPSKHVKTTA